MNATIPEVIARELRQIPLIPRCVVAAAAIAGVLGAAWGLIAGITEDTVGQAFFAIFEGFFVAAIAGSVVGLAAGLLVFAVARAARGIRHARG